MSLFRRKKEVGAEDLSESQIYTISKLYEQHQSSRRDRMSPEEIAELSVSEDVYDPRGKIGIQSNQYRYRADLKELKEKGLVAPYEWIDEDRNRKKIVKSEYVLTGPGIELAGKIAKRKGLVSKVKEDDGSFSASTWAAIIPKPLSFIFLISGLFFMVLSDFSSTGNVIASNSQSSANLPAFLSVLLAIIGGVLFVKSR